MKNLAARLSGLRDQIDEIHRRMGLEDLSTHPVDQIVVILGSSRCGSSLLFHLLAESGAFWSPQGEETPFYRAAGLGFVDNELDSDAIGEPLSKFSLLQARRLLMADLGRSSKPSAASDDTDYIAQVAARLVLQWPAGLPPTDSLLTLIRKTLDHRVTNAEFWTAVLQGLGKDAGFYDIPGLPTDRSRPLAIPNLLLEEPPFVLQTPRPRPHAADLQTRPVLLKSTSNAYRFPLLRGLFPEARFKWILLTRNPAGAINGLIDGWLSNAFHAHPTGGLNIRGYSEQKPEGHRWWKFDLPPGWRTYASGRLPEVCAFQWASAYQAARAGLARCGEPVLQVRYEDLMHPGRNAETLNRIFDFAGSPPDRLPEVGQARVVMASRDPRPLRWKQRFDWIWPLVESAEYRPVAEDLGYDLGESDSFL